MRTSVFYLLLALALIGARVAHGQTFSAPWTFNKNPYVQTANTCDLPYQYMYFSEFGYVPSGPSAVYRVYNLPRFNLPSRFLPWHVTMTPYAADLSIFVCTAHSGNSVFGCVDASDNGYGLANQVTVPGYAGQYYVIVTSNMFGEYPQCGAYMLSAAYY